MSVFSGAAPVEKSPLTARQLEVVSLIVQGKSIAGIAKFLKRSPLTVKKHIEQLYERLGIHNRASAVNWWHEHGKKLWTAAAPTPAE